LGGWLGLLAVALQLAFAPILSQRALAMAIDPLADAEFCLSSPQDSTPLPTQPGHPGHCDQLCLAACATHACPGLVQNFVDSAAPAPVKAVDPGRAENQKTAFSRTSLRIRAPPLA
jgi:hypothetical protein